MHDKHKKPPQTVSEVGIHVGYLREDIGDLKLLLENNMAMAATKAEVNALSVKVDKLESINSWVTKLIVGAVITAAMSFLVWTK